MRNLRTQTINGQYAYRAWDGLWYVIIVKTGAWTGETFETRSHAVAAMGAC